MKIIGWVLIITGILSIFSSSIYLSFEGVVTVLVPIVGGIILLVKASKKSS